MIPLAAARSEALGSWAAAALFGLTAILYGAFLQPRLARMLVRLGRRYPRQFRHLSPRTDDEGLAGWERRSRTVTVIVGAVFLLIGTVGFLVRLAVT